MHEWSAGKTETETPRPQSIVSPPDTGHSCSAARRSRANTRIVSLGADDRRAAVVRHHVGAEDVVEVGVADEERSPLA